MTTPTTSRTSFAELVTRSLPLLLVAAALLAILESFWLLQRGIELDVPRALIVATALASALVAAALAVLGVLVIGERLVPRFPAALLMLAGVWPAYLVVESLFSGGRAREIPQIGIIKTAFAVALVASIPIAVWIFRTLARMPRGHLRRATALGAALAAAALAYADTRVQVGLYPAAHYLLAGSVLYCAALAAVLAIPEHLPSAARIAAAAVAGVAVAATALTWQSTATLTVATYSDGLMPKVRGSVVGIARAVASMSRGTQAATALEVRPDEFRFRPTQAAELDEIRGRVRNVVFILSDAVRNDHIGLVKNGKSITPFVDALDDRLIRFQNAYSGSDATGQSMPVLMTSYPFSVTNRAPDLAIPLPTWVEMLRERGYRTFANGNCDYVAIRFPHVPISTCYGAEHVGTTADRREVHVPEILDFVADGADQPFAIFTHWMDAHIVKSVKNPRDEYADMIGQIDARVNELLAGLEQLGHGDDTMIVWTADHGYALGESNRFLGGQCCAELLVRVPLFVYLPGSSRAGTVVEQNVSAIDVMPTILDVLVPDRAAMVGGRSLLGLLYDTNDPRLTNEHAVYTLGTRVHMLRQGPLKMHWDEWNDTKLVIDVETDPDEVQPLVLDGPRDRLWRSMQAELDRHAQLGAALSVGDRDVDSNVVAILLRSARLSEGDLEPFLENFWQRSADTRYALLQAIVRQRLDGLDGELAELTRADRWEPTDQFLLVTRAFLQGDEACEALAPRVADLHAEPRTWLAETYREMSEPCKELFTEPLLAATRRARTQNRWFEDAEGPFRLLAASFLAEHLKEATPRDIKEQLRDLFNASRGARYLHKVPSVRGQLPYDRRRALRSLEESVTADDLDIVADLLIDKHSMVCLATVARKLATPDSVELVREAVSQSNDLEEANSILYILRNSEGPDDVDEAIRVAIAERFPRVDASI